MSLSTDNMSSYYVLSMLSFITLSLMLYFLYKILKNIPEPVQQPQIPEPTSANSVNPTQLNSRSLRRRNPNLSQREITEYQNYRSLLSEQQKAKYNFNKARRQEERAARRREEEKQQRKLDRLEEKEYSRRKKVFENLEKRNKQQYDELEDIVQYIRKYRVVDFADLDNKYAEAKDTKSLVRYLLRINILKGYFVGKEKFVEMSEDEKGRILEFIQEEGKVNTKDVERFVFEKIFHEPGFKKSILQ
eukprot:snap_masked-scaffold_83-processed-gene-0.16-mRNA-1 protein AED:1.00 eAED:1.00 QI:0/-1/0/0/-1/1/1/0/245